MGWYADRVAPRLVSCACGAPPIAACRERVVPQARGVVLELGFGSGLNLPHYDAGAVRCLYALEPFEPIARLGADRVAASPLDVRPLRAGAEAVPLPDESVDTVVATFTLCTVPDVSAALAEARRVLRPGGRVLFAEHGLAPDAGVARWQRRLQPAWGRLAGGCHLTRDVPSLLHEAGFGLDGLDQGYVPRVPRVAGYVSTGTAQVQ